MSINNADRTPLISADLNNTFQSYESIGQTFDEATTKTKTEHKNALGTFNGCFIPCCLNIMGVILFLKLGWGIGNVGVVGMLFIFVIAEVLCVLTVLSLSAILTN